MHKVRITESQLRGLVKQMIKEEFSLLRENDFIMPVYDKQTRTMSDKAVQFTDFQLDTDKMNDGTMAAYVAVNVPAENRNGARFANGKVGFGTYVNSNGDSTGKFWYMADPSDKKYISQIKDWTPLKNYVKSQFMKQQQR